MVPYVKLELDLGRHREVLPRGTPVSVPLMAKVTFNNEYTKML